MKKFALKALFASVVFYGVSLGIGEFMEQAKAGIDRAQDRAIHVQ